MRRKLSELWHSVPKDIRLMSWATSIRWAGWDMIEPLSAVFLFSILHDYGRAAVVESMAGITFFLIVPFVGILADRMSLKKFLIIGLVFFFFGGFTSLSAATSLVIFAIVANIGCGIAIASDVVGRVTYIRRYAPEERVATVIGFQNTFLYSGTLLGACITLLIADHASFASIFFWVVPTYLVTLLLFIAFLKKDKPRAVKKDEMARYSFREYASVWRDATSKESGLRLLAFLEFVFWALFSFCTVLIPIYAFVHGANYQEITLLYLLANLPQIFSSPFGRMADRWHRALLPIGMLAIAVMIGSFAMIHSFPFILVGVLVIETILVLLGLCVENLITSMTEPERYGRVGSVFEGLKEVGKFTGAIGLGFAVDALGTEPVFIALAIGTAILGLALWKGPRETSLSIESDELLLGDELGMVGDIDIP